MSDIFSVKERSAIMSRVRSKGNRATELRFIVLLKKWQLTGWRRNYPIFGHPDFVFPKQRLAIFIDGCFWHGCSKHRNIPVNNRPFWKEKLLANKTRDLKVNRILRKKGWRVIRIWEHDLVRRGEKCIRKLRAAGILHFGAV